MAARGIYVYSRTRTYGPYEEAELRAHLREGRVPFAAWVFRDGAWRLLAEDPDLRTLHPGFEESPKGKPDESEAADPGRLSAHAAAGDTSSADTSASLWFVIRDKIKHGPYSAADLIAQLQRRELEPNAFVWRPGFATWQKMSTVTEFSRTAMKRLASEPSGVDILVKRKFPRKPYEVEVIGHDNRRAIEGKTLVLGEGGFFLATARPVHGVGTRLKVHFRSAGLPPFNAVAEVVSVLRGGEMPGYSMKFVALSEADRRKIAKFTSEEKRSPQR